MDFMKKKARGKIGIIFPGSIFTTPYLKRYTDIIERSGMEYDLIYWNTQNIAEESSAAEAICLNYQMTPTSSLIRKIVGYFKFVMMSNHALRKTNYEKVIILTSISAVFLYGTLKKKYRKQYLLDIRDYYKENRPLYYLFEKKEIENSSRTIISSEGFKHFLPPQEYVITHNINWIEPEIVQNFRNEDKRNKKCINISFIGNMRFPQQDRAIIDCFANDSRFNVNFFGSGYGIHESYCTENKIFNVSILDWFPPEMTIDLYRKTDMVLNLYGSGTPLLDFALSNKLYYAAQLGKPILVCPHTYMEKISTEYNFGFSFDFKIENIKDRLFEYYQSIDWKKFYKNCDEYLLRVRMEDELFVKSVENFIITNNDQKEFVNGC